MEKQDETVERNNIMEEKTSSVLSDSALIEKVITMRSSSPFDKILNWWETIIDELSERDAVTILDDDGCELLELHNYEKFMMDAFLKSDIPQVDDGRAMSFLHLNQADRENSLPLSRNDLKNALLEQKARKRFLPFAVESVFDISPQLHGTLLMSCGRAMSFLHLNQADRENSLPLSRNDLKNALLEQKARKRFLPFAVESVFDISPQLHGTLLMSCGRAMSFLHLNQADRENSLPLSRNDLKNALLEQKARKRFLPFAVESVFDISPQLHGTLLMSCGRAMSFLHLNQADRENSLPLSRNDLKNALLEQKARKRFLPFAVESVFDISPQLHGTLLMSCGRAMSFLHLNQADRENSLPLSRNDLKNALLEQKARKRFLPFAVESVFDISPQLHGTLLMSYGGLLSYLAKSSITPFEFQFTDTPVQSLLSFEDAVFAFFPEMAHIAMFMIFYILTWMLVLRLHFGVQIFLILLLISAPFFYFPELVRKASASGVHVACGGSFKLPLIGFSTLGAFGITFVFGLVALLVFYLIWRFVHGRRPTRGKDIEVSSDGLLSLISNV